MPVNGCVRLAGVLAGETVHISGWCDGGVLRVRPRTRDGRSGGAARRPGDPAKALLDLVYFTPAGDEERYLESLRLENLELRQTGWEGRPLDEAGWRPEVRSRVEQLDWDAAERDVAPFLEPGPATELFRRESLLKLLSPGR